MRPRTFIGAGCAALAARPGTGDRPGARDHRGRHARAPPGSGDAAHGRARGDGDVQLRGHQASTTSSFTSGPDADVHGRGADVAQERPLVRRVHVPDRGRVRRSSARSTTSPPYATMRGTIRVVAPTPTPDPDPSATPQPGATPTPAPTPAGRQPAADIAEGHARLRPEGQRACAGRSRCSRAASRLEVTLRARLTRARVRVGRHVRASAGPGVVRFSVPLDAEGQARAAQPQAARRDGRRRAHAAGWENGHTQSEGETARLASMGCAASSSCSRPVSRSPPAARTQRPATEPRVSLKLDVPSDGGSVRAETVAVRGTVTPADAAVRVAGEDAQVEGGEFSAEVDAPAGRERDRHHGHRARAAGPATDAVRVLRDMRVKVPPLIGQESDAAVAALRKLDLTARRCRRPAAGSTACSAARWRSARPARRPARSSTRARP